MAEESNFFMDDRQIIEKQFDFYLQNQDSLVAQYNGKVLVIHDEKIAGSFFDKVEAYRFGMKNFRPGTFLIIKCTPGDSDYTIDYRTVHRFERLATI